MTIGDVLQLLLVLGAMSVTAISLVAFMIWRKRLQRSAVEGYAGQGDSLDKRTHEISS